MFSRRSDESVLERERHRDSGRNEAGGGAGDQQTLQELSERRIFADTAESLAERRIIYILFNEKKLLMIFVSLTDEVICCI